MPDKLDSDADPLTSAPQSWQQRHRLLLIIMFAALGWIVVAGLASLLWQAIT